MRSFVVSADAIASFKYKIVHHAANDGRDDGGRQSYRLEGSFLLPRSSHHQNQIWDRRYRRIQNLGDEHLNSSHWGHKQLSSLPSHLLVASPI